MPCRLPALVDPHRLARQRVRLKDTLPVMEMARVEALVGDRSGTVDFDLRFRLSSAGVPRLEGDISLKARTTCQRCLETIELPVASTLRLSFTGDDEPLAQTELAAGYEPMEAVGQIGLATLIEDEILLAIPEYPMHPRGVCAPAGEAQPGVPAGSPLAALGVLRERRGPSRT